ncbi:MAG: Gfo/Idh/MocA family oxidoreductase, partial [Actinobacteria bacterium]|nr:Gfo/Idh/MocA family oxidoreductase [Actinomycetota bacterium]
MTKLRAVTIAHAGKGNAGHALHRTFTDSAEVEMVALSDPDPAGRAKLSGECGARASYADYREMLAREKPDIVVIGRHYYDDARVEQFLAAVQSGAKGVFLEKPVAAWPDQAHRMLAAADAKGVAVALAHRSREHPTLHAVKRRADAGEWGPLMHVKGQGKGDQRTGTVDLLVLGTHVLDAMLFMLGANPVSCWGTVLVDGRAATRADATESPTYGAGRMAGNRLTAEYQFPNGVIGTYESLPVGDGAAGTEYLGADFYFQQAIVSTRGLPLGEFHVFPRGGIFPQADLGSWLRIPV